MKNLSFTEQKQIVGGAYWVYVYERRSRRLVQKYNFGNNINAARKCIKARNNRYTAAVLKVINE